MTTHQGGHAGEDPLGSAAEEAAKLFGALADDLATHVGGGEECRYCPICRSIQVFRSLSPEVREHLAQAASSLAQAVTAALATTGSGATRGPVEHIDVGEEWPEDGTEDP